MYIESIKIGNFGKLSGREYSLSSGLNLIEGKNESGKSTLCEFIKFVFYGLSGRSVGGEISERKRHISWSANEASGSVVLNDGENRYRIERLMSPSGNAYRDEVTVVDLASGALIGGIKCPGEYFFGIPEEVFVGTVYIRQVDGAYFDGGNIGQAIQNIFYSADESVNTEKALKKLDEARVMIRHKKNTGRGMLDSLERERDTLTEALEKARSVNDAVLKNEESLRLAAVSVKKNKAESERLSAQLRKNELYGILEKFARRREYEKQIEEGERAKAEIVEATTFNGFFPDGEYRDRLQGLKKELIMLEENYEKLKDTSDCGEEAVFSEEMAQYIKESGGSEGVGEFADELRSKSRAGKVAGTILGILALCMVVAGFVLTGLISKIFFAAGGVSAVIAAVCLWSAGSSKSKYHDLLAYFEAEDEEEMIAVAKQVEEAEKYEEQRHELLKYRDAQALEAEEKLNACLENAVTALSEWGLSPDGRTVSDVLPCLEDAVHDVSEITLGIDSLEREIEKNAAVMAVLDSSLEGYDMNGLLAEFEGIDCKAAPDRNDELKKRFEFLRIAGESLAERISNLERNLVELKAGGVSPAETESRLAAVNTRIAELEKKHRAYVLAYEKLEEAGTNLRSRLAPGLAATAGRLMNRLTDGKYKEIGVSDELAMTYTFEDRGALFTKEIDFVSSGTRDIAYVSLRLALAEMFGKKGKKLLVVFDESFSRLDEDRLKNMLSVAEGYASDSQVIVMTSQKREGELLDGGVNRISL